MAGGHPRLPSLQQSRTWMPRTSPGITRNICLTRAKLPVDAVPMQLADDASFGPVALAPRLFSPRCRRGLGDGRLGVFQTRQIVIRFDHRGPLDIFRSLGLRDLRGLRGLGGLRWVDG